MTRQLEALIVDDSPDDAALILRELTRAGYAVEHQRVDTREDMRLALGERRWQIVLCDYAMPSFSALQALSLVHQLGWSGPLLVVSGTIGEERAVECMRAGACDLILKDRLARLVPAIERELDAYARRVEQERTRQQLALAEEALLRSQKLRIIGQMTAGISHDLKNLLHPMGLYVDLIRGALAQGDDQEAQDCADELGRVVASGLALVDRLRTFSRPPAALAVSEVELDRVAREALNVIRPRTSDNGTRVKLREELGAPAAVRADVNELLAALVNLLGNAIDAGATTITVRTGVDTSWAFVEVEDDGRGMPSEIKARAFEPFFTTKGEQGTGLGLAMVHAAVLRQDGCVTLESEPSSGTRIRLSLPRKRSCEAAIRS